MHSSMKTGKQSQDSSFMHGYPVMQVVTKYCITFDRTVPCCCTPCLRWIPCTLVMACVCGSGIGDADRIDIMDALDARFSDTCHHDCA